MLAGCARALLLSLAEPGIEQWLAAWPHDAVSELSHATAPGRPLPVLQWLPRAAQAAPALSAELCAMLAHAAPDLAWRQTYTSADVARGAIGANFLERYGWCELIGPHAALVSEHMACGFLLLGPDTHYPSHTHEAEELYLPLSGTASWRQDQGDSKGEWRNRTPGTLVHHAPFEPHAMRTGMDPLLALYVWRGGDVQARARLDANGTANR